MNLPQMWHRAPRHSTLPVKKLAMYRPRFTCDWRIVISPAPGHVTLLRPVLGLARIELVVADSKGIGAG